MKYLIVVLLSAIVLSGCSTITTETKKDGTVITTEKHCGYLILWRY